MNKYLLTALILVLLILGSCDKYAGATRKHGAMTIEENGRRFTINLSIQVRGGALFIPESLPDSGAALVIALHGMGSSGESFRAYGFDQYAERYGFIVVYPDGLKGGWSSPDDNAFFDHIIQELKKRYHIDERKVFMTGHSLGAIQCYESAVILAGKISAIAAVSSPMAADTARLTVILGPQHQTHDAKPVRVLIIHSLDDNVIPYDGKMIGNIYSVGQTLEFWNKVNDCPDTWSAYPCGPGFDGRVWRGAHAECVVLTRFQGGHHWPSNATEMITAFLLDRYERL